MQASSEQLACNMLMSRWSSGCRFSTYVWYISSYPTVLLLQVHLQQIQTGVFLASSSQKFQRPIAGQQEIFGRSKKDDWTATQGVFFPSRSAA